MSRPKQMFPSQYLEDTECADATQIARWLDDYRKLHAAVSPSKAKLISIKVPEDLLLAFKSKASMEGMPYQTQIKNLMRLWLKQNS